jgi:hypothetical protein
MSEFLDQVRSILVPSFEQLGLQLCDTRVGDSFGDAYAVFHGPQFRVRVLRDRGQVFVDFGSPADATNWFNMPIVARILGFSAGNEADGPDDRAKLGWVAALVRNQVSKLEAAFSPEHYSRSKALLERMEHSSVEARFGTDR